jgi:hypothetical protein
MRFARSRRLREFRCPFFRQTQSCSHIVESHTFRRGGKENGMETMKIHVLERALTAACIVAAIAVVWWGFKILAA